MPLIQKVRQVAALDRAFFEIGRKKPAGNYRGLSGVTPSHVRATILMRKIFKSQSKGKRWITSNDTPTFVEEGGLAVGGQTHHLVFVTKLPEAEILSEGRVIDSQRMRERYLAQRAYSRSFANAAHEACEVTQSVCGEHCRPIEWRDKKCA